jgi:hypothetical protein
VKMMIHKAGSPENSRRNESAEAADRLSMDYGDTG